MEYTSFGKTGLNVSRLGLGCMRFPSRESDAIDMVRYAIDHGINYLDTAYMYGESEAITGKALKGGYREKIILATKSPTMIVKNPADFEKYLDIQLKRLGTDYIDVYLMHNLDQPHWQTVQRFDGLAFLDRMREKGKIRHKACSVHNTFAGFKEIIDAYDWEMAQIQLNILDQNHQVGLEGLYYGAAKNLAMVIMEPLRGGHFVMNTPPKVAQVVEAYPEKRSLVEWCFRYLYNMPEVTVILSGASSMEQLKDNLRIFEHSAPDVLSRQDDELISAIKSAFEERFSIGCTGCKYCMPCPRGVNIPEIFRLYNSYELLKPHWIDRVVYESFVDSGLGADRCVSCGQCVKQCPQGFEIPRLLKEAHTALLK